MVGEIRWPAARLPVFLVGVVLVVLSSVAPAAADVAPFEVREYRKDFDVPVQQAEETLETQASGAEQDIVGQLEDGLGSSYAGLWFDDQAGEFVPVLGSASRTQARSEFAEAGLIGEYRTAPAQSSWAKLEAVQEQLNHALAQPMLESYVQTSIDPARTRSLSRSPKASSLRPSKKCERWPARSTSVWK